MIRLANKDDINDVLKIYDIAKNFMGNNGNKSQWNKNYPNKNIVMDDISNGTLYVIIIDNEICGVFTFLIGKEPTYEYIEGSWKYDLEYGTIHRLASSQTKKGIFKECMNFCKSKHDYIRVDTHNDNKILQKLLEKHGFEKSGIIYVLDGSPRIAYEYMRKYE